MPAARAHLSRSTPTTPDRHAHGDTPQDPPRQAALHQALRAPGRGLDSDTRVFMETRLGRDLRGVRIHDDDAGAAAAEALGALAFTAGRDLVFAQGRYAPGTLEGRRLLAHELAHAVQQGVPAHSPGAVAAPGSRPQPDRAEQEANHIEAFIDAGNGRAARAPALRANSVPAGTVQRKPAPDPRKQYPWEGKITAPWNAALRKGPSKDPADPHANTLADLPAGTEVLVTNVKSGWLLVEVTLGGKKLNGYVSQELVTFVKASAFALAPVTVSVHLPSIAEAFVMLKRAETRKRAEPAWTPAEEEQDDLELAASILEKTGKYSVAKTSWQVSFQTKPGQKVKIDSIEDFILFVEAVELQYPAAKPAEIASEIRQLWYSDVNWEVLVASQGIKGGGAQVDIETEPNPVALMFDMQDLAPAKGGKRIATRMGEVDIGHVLAGIDAALSGGPSTYPKAFLAAQGHDDYQAELKYQVLSRAAGGDVRDFATWAGDLGQAYAEYLAAHYVKSEPGSLTDFVAGKATDAELLGDIHGYIANLVWKKLPASASPSGGEFRISNILRDLYLVDKPSAATYRDYMELVSERTGPDLRSFVRFRSLAFARPWYAKEVIGHRGKWASPGWTAREILDNALTEFDTRHAQHEANAAVAPADRIDAAVDHFMALLSASIK